MNSKSLFEMSPSELEHEIKTRETEIAALKKEQSARTGEGAYLYGFTRNGMAFGYPSIDEAVRAIIDLTGDEDSRYQVVRVYF